MIDTLDLIPNDSQRSGHTPTCRVLVYQNGLAEAGDLTVTNRYSLVEVNNLSVSLRHNLVEIGDLPMEFNHGLVEDGDLFVAFSQLLYTEQKLFVWRHAACRPHVASLV